MKCVVLVFLCPLIFFRLSSTFHSLCCIIHTLCTVSYCLSLSTTPIWHWNRAWKTLNLYPFPPRFVHYLTVGPSTHQVFPEYQPIQFPYTALLRIYRISPEGRAPKIHTQTHRGTHTYLQSHTDRLLTYEFCAVSFTSFINLNYNITTNTWKKGVGGKVYLGIFSASPFS